MDTLPELPTVTDVEMTSPDALTPSRPHALMP